MALPDIFTPLQNLLKGEPARVIGYGAAVAIFIGANVLDAVPDMTFDEAIARGASIIVAIGVVIESIRQLVYSPNTVQAIATKAAITGDDTVPPPPANTKL